MDPQRSCVLRRVGQVVAAGTAAAAGAGGSIIAAAASVQVPERPTTMKARKVKGMFIATPYRNRRWKFHEQDALKRP